MDRNWEDTGISWLEEKVSTKAGNTKVEVSGTAQIPQVDDVQKALEHFGEEAFKGGLNGTSWRVAAQDVNRRLLPTKPTVEQLREAVYNRLKGIRNAAVGVRTVTVKVYTLADGTSFVPDANKSTQENTVALQAAATAALVDKGVPAEIARSIALGMTL